MGKGGNYFSTSACGILPPLWWLCRRLASPYGRTLAMVGKVPYAGKTPCNLQPETTAMLRIVSTLMSGLFIGLAARWLYPGTVPMGWGLTILLGMGGSLFAEILANRGAYGPPRPAGCLASVVGALALIFIGRHLGW
jgi:uncharacterized membrane protein YeaQ/YmgE (transglycosylase-associated protein family)